MRIETRKLEEYPVLARIIFWFQSKKYGHALESSKLWARVPRLMYGLQVLFRTVDSKNSPIEPALRSLISLRISQINHCAFCTDIGLALLEKRGVSQEKVEALPLYQSSSLFNEKERAALSYAEAMTFSDRRIDGALFERIKSFFKDDEIIELTALIGYQNLASKFNSALDVPSQGFCKLPRK